MVGILIFVLFYLLLKMLTCIEKAIRQMTQMQYANGCWLSFVYILLCTAKFKLYKMII